MQDSNIRHAVCDLCDNEEKGTIEELISRGWFMGMMGETCPDHHNEPTTRDRKELHSNRN